MAGCMTKDRLKDKLVDFQKEIIELSSTNRKQTKQFQDAEDHLLLDVVAVMDAFENVFAHLETKEPTFDKTAQRAMNSFRSIYRKLARVLEDKGVAPVEFRDGRAQMEWCQIVETKCAPGQAEGTILAMIKRGYRRGDRVLRPAEVITVANGGD